MDRDKHVRLGLTGEACALIQGNEDVLVPCQVRLEARRRIDLAGQLACDGQGDVLLTLAALTEGTRVLTAVAGIDGDHQRAHVAIAHDLLDRLDRRGRHDTRFDSGGRRAVHRRGLTGGDLRGHACGDAYARWKLCGWRGGHGRRRCRHAALRLRGRGWRRCRHLRRSAIAGQDFADES